MRWGLGGLGSSKEVQALRVELFTRRARGRGSGMQSQGCKDRPTRLWWLRWILEGDEGQRQEAGRVTIDLVSITQRLSQ